jgi:F0F1-type ATP synthase membrane subunit b/b'
VSGLPEPVSDRYNAFVPVLLVIVAALGWYGFQTVALIRDYRGLEETRAAQVTPVEQAEKLRAATDALAAKTQKLADGGNANAQLIVANLKQRGIVINPAAKSAVAPK